MNSIRVAYPIDREVVEMLKAIVPLGCMASSAMVSPILFEIRKIWFPDVLIFFVSSTTFLLQHHAEVKTYGPFSLVLAAVFGIAAISSARSSLKELTPWIPIALCLLNLLTAFSLPRLYQAFKDPGPEEAMEAMEAMEEGRANELRGPIGVAIPVRLDEGYRPMETSLEMDQLLILNISKMGRPESRLSRGFSVHDSDIDLNDHAQTAGIALRRMDIQQWSIAYLLARLPARIFCNPTVFRPYLTGYELLPEILITRVPWLSDIPVIIGGA
ncbi:hypothetical protein IFR05_011756 [Cadophora sp. M221]|nr:hypothetical protein IFR05_011756 [Cadophora sp. M221]